MNIIPHRDIFCTQLSFKTPSVKALQEHSLLSDNAIYNANYATMPFVRVFYIFQSEITIFWKQCINDIGQRMPIVQLHNL